MQVRTGRDFRVALGRHFDQRRADLAFPVDVAPVAQHVAVARVVKHDGDEVIVSAATIEATCELTTFQAFTYQSKRRDLRSIPVCFGDKRTSAAVDCPSVILSAFLNMKISIRPIVTPHGHPYRRIWRPLGISTDPSYHPSTFRDRRKKNVICRFCRQVRYLGTSAKQR